MATPFYFCGHPSRAGNRYDTNTACLGEKVDDLMEVDEMTDHHLGEEVDDLMKVDEVTDNHLEEKVDDLMEVDEVANYSI